MTLWCISFALSVNLLRIHSAPLSRSVMKIIKRIRSSIDPQCTLVTDLQLDFVPLITTLWARPFSQFSIHLTVSSGPYSFSMKIFWKRVSKTLLNYKADGSAAS